ncbi:MAG: response regulator [Thermoleophilia bacterium]
MQLLIAHADASAREALKRVVADLPGGDLEIIESGDGLETMEYLLAAESPRIALVDWDLPGCDGLEICRLVRAYYEAGRPYVILLGRADHRIADGLEGGADDCVHTPVPADELRARVGVGRRFADRPRERVLPGETQSAPAAVRESAAMLSAQATLADIDYDCDSPAAERRSQIRLVAHQADFDNETPSCDTPSVARFELESMLFAR